MLTIARILIAVVLCFAPWAFGSTERWSQLAIQALVVLAAASVSISVIRGRTQSLWSWRWGAPLLLFFIYIALQASNATHQQHATGQNPAPLAHIAWLPHSVDATATWEALGWVATCAMLFWTVRLCFSRPAEVKVLLALLVISGFAMALAAILVKVSGERNMLWFREPPRWSSVMGPFANRNNYAAYINLLVPVALALGFRAQLARSRNHGKSDPGYLLYFMAAVMVASVFLSQSRAGMIVCAGLIGAGLVMEFWQGMRTGRGRVGAAVWATVVMALLVTGLLFYLGFEPIKERLATLQGWNRELFGTGGRAAIYRVTLDMLRDHWQYGVGAGAFGCAFPHYETPSLAGFFSHGLSGLDRFTHCDWLQYLAELGGAGGLLVAFCGIGILRKRMPTASSSTGTRDASAETRPYGQQVAVALSLALAGVGAHAFVDFPMHIPGVAILAVTYAAILSAKASEEM